MKKIFLASDLGCSIKINGVRFSKEMDNTNGVVNQIKDYLTGNNKMVFLVSDPNDHEKNEAYAKRTFDSFSKSGIIFENKILINGKYQGNIVEEIKTSDLVFLSGGKTEVQMKFFEYIGLKEILKDYNGLIIGQSAGALNLATNVLCSPEEEEEIGKNYKWSGLGKTNINIEPHFVLNVVNELDIKLREELLKISSEKRIYAICDGTHIFIDDVSAKLFGEAYLIENGNITKINDNHIELDITPIQANSNKKLF